MALEGAREDAERSTGAVALFHLICSAAGFHLCKTEQLPRSKYKFESQALEHHNLGITHLRNQIQSEDETQYEAVLASLIMCLLNEAITVYDPFWRLHIQGAVDWVNHVGLEYWNRSESARTIYQMFMCMGILIQSQILPGDRSNHGWFLRYNPESQPGPYILDSIFGIPECILEVICTMNCVQTDARQGNGEARQDQSSPTYDLDTLELELFLMVPRRPNLSVTNQKYEQLLYHHGYAYYYAAILYMKRTLKGVPLKEVQNLVKQALQHVEALHNVDTGPSSPSLWPIAIIAFEAQDPLLQKRMQTSLDAFAKQSRLEVWVKFAESVRGLWARRRQSPGEGNLSWHAYSPVFYHNYVFI
jgi:hypothetical protein